MNILGATEARNGFLKIMKQVNKHHEPVFVKGKKTGEGSGDVVILSAEDYSSIQETLYLLSIPGMKESIIEALNEPITSCSDKLDW